DADRYQRRPGFHELEDVRFGGASNLLDAHLDLLVEPHRVKDVEAVERPAPAIVPVGDRRPLIAVDVGALTPGGTDVILGAGADERRRVSIAVEPNLDLTL